MALRISGKNMSIGEALRTHVRTRIDLTISKFSAGPFNGHVTIEPEGSGFRSDCTLHLGSGMTLQVEAAAQEAYASFNRAADRIEERLRRYKRRIRNKHGAHEAASGDNMPERPNPSQAIDFGAAVFGEFDSVDSEETGEAGPAVIAEPKTGLKEMTVSSAVLELDLTMVPVVVFRHSIDGRPSIVYRRPDGNIGWIDGIPA